MERKSNWPMVLMGLATLMLTAFAAICWPLPTIAVVLLIIGAMLNKLNESVKGQDSTTLAVGLAISTTLKESAEKIRSESVVEITPEVMRVILTACAMQGIDPNEEETEN